MMYFDWTITRSKSRDVSTHICPESNPCNNDLQPTFIYVPFDEEEDVWENFDSIDGPVSPRGKTFEEQIYGSHDIELIKGMLGSEFADHRITKRGRYTVQVPWLHQGIVIMQHIEHTFEREVFSQSWDWLKDQIDLIENSPLRNRRLPHRMFTAPENPYVFLLGWFARWDPNAQPQLPSTMAKIMSLQELHGKTFRCFPSLSEMIQDEQKLGDIRALDILAAKSPPEYTYRPATCAVHGKRRTNKSLCPLQGDCSLAGQKKLVIKRTASQDGTDVKTVDRDGEIFQWVKNTAAQYRWFGQEFVESLQEFGEFRVFIVARPNKTGIRGRRGAVIHTIRSVHDKKHRFQKHAAKDRDFQSPYIYPLRSSDLEQFALYVYEHLRGRDDWKEKFESLEVGVRLDIGVGEDPTTKDKRFFVNEVTRVSFASYFSKSTLTGSKQQLCIAFAEALSNYFN